jgi:exopolysaccharide biosynthesis polyprenyl glycosylphosphotransferase
MTPDPTPRTCEPARPGTERVTAPRTYEPDRAEAGRTYYEEARPDAERSGGTRAYESGPPAGTAAPGLLDVQRTAGPRTYERAPRPAGPRGAGQPRHRAVRERVGGVLAVADCAGAVAGAVVTVPRAALAGSVVAACLLLTQHRAGLYRPGFTPGAFAELPGIALRTVLAWGVLAVVAGGRPPGPADLLTAVGLTVAVAGGLRAAVYGTRRWAARRRPASTLVVGPDAASAARIAAVLHARPEYGMRPVGLAAPTPVRPAPPEPQGRAGDPPRTPMPPPVLPVLPSPGDVTRAVVQNAVRHAVVTGPATLDARTTATVRLLAAQGCRLWQVDGERRGPRAGHLWGHACRRFEPYPPTAGRAARGGKRALDAALAAAALLCLAPVLAGCALAMRLADGPGVIFRQERIGLHGRPFTLLKFRTLRPADEHESATLWSVADDDRMSRAGRLLRRTSLDELPQLWNVLRGDMSLVGPRPERPYFVTQFSQTLPGYADRHRMPAGITGLAQVHGLRGDTSIADRARFDNHYIDSWTLWQDVSILLRTAAAVFRCGGS